MLLPNLSESFIMEDECHGVTVMWNAEESEYLVSRVIKNGYTLNKRKMKAEEATYLIMKWLSNSAFYFKVLKANY